MSHEKRATIFDHDSHITWCFYTSLWKQEWMLYRGVAKITTSP